MDNSFGSQRSLLFRVFHNEFFRLFLLAALLSAVLYSLEIYSDWYSLSVGTPNTVILTIGDYAFWILLICSLSLPIVLAAILMATLLGKDNHRGFLVLSFLVAYIAVGFGCFGVGHLIRVNAFHQIVQRGMPIVDAIKKYIVEQGHPPAILDELVPHYLPEIPKTQFETRNSTEYIYEVGKEHRHLYDNPWGLKVLPPLGGFGIETLMYLPLQNYDKNQCRPIYDWVHCRGF